MLVNICLYLAIVNLAAVGAFAFDKQASMAPGRRRVRENTLLMLAAIGGSVGAVAAQQGLRHKTRKEPFRTQLYLTCVLQVVAMVGLAAYVFFLLA